MDRMLEMITELQEAKQKAQLEKMMMRKGEAASQEAMGTESESPKSVLDHLLLKKIMR